MVERLTGSLMVGGEGDGGAGAGLRDKMGNVAGWDDGGGAG